MVHRIDMKGRWTGSGAVYVCVSLGEKVPPTPRRFPRRCRKSRGRHCLGIFRACRPVTVTFARRRRRCRRRHEAEPCMVCVERLQSLLMSHTVPLVPPILAVRCAQLEQQRIDLFICADVEPGLFEGRMILRDDVGECRGALGRPSDDAFQQRCLPVGQDGERHAA